MLGLLGLGPVREKPQAQAQRQLQVRLVQLTRRVLLVQREPQALQVLLGLRVRRELQVRLEVRER